MKKLLLLLGLVTALTVRADEGMWFMHQISPALMQEMRKLGLELTQQQLYNSDAPALQDAVVSFGDYCTGVVVSPNGLVFTNHHCGFSSIQQSSTPEHDYLHDGFVARTFDEEIPCPGLFVRFTSSSMDITKNVQTALLERAKQVKKLLKKHQPIPANLTEEAVISQMESTYDKEVKESLGDSFSAEISSLFGGEQFTLNIYRTYNDIRLVFAPPACAGKFGGDTDNWVWPRETCDFSVFRIYADTLNHPAEYSPDNRPWYAYHHVPIARQGYQSGDFAMTIGFPGSTERYLSSYGISDQMKTGNAARIEARGLKQGIWRRWMDSDPVIRLKYDDKYARSSNYWKNSIGMNESIERLGILQLKQQQEQKAEAWAQQQKSRRQYQHLSDSLSTLYSQSFEPRLALSYFIECFSQFFQSPVARLCINFHVDQPERSFARIRTYYKDMDARVEEETALALIQLYRNKFADKPGYMPQFYHTADSLYGGDLKAYVHSLYSGTILSDSTWLPQMTDTAAIRRFTADLAQKPEFDLTMDLMATYTALLAAGSTYDEAISRNENRLSHALRFMDEATPHYADANSTMRLSYGTVGAYTSVDGLQYPLYTTPETILKKAATSQSNPDYELNDSLQNLLRCGDFGPYKDPVSQTLQLCFVTNNDITGGNSGSPMFNGRGELIGLAFDGNWDAMSSDLAFNTALTRCIGVDIRYVLFLIHRWGHADRLIHEIAQP